MGLSITKAVTAAPVKTFNAGPSFGQALEWAGISTSTGATLTTEKAMRHSAFFGAVKVLAEDIAKLPLHVYSDPEGHVKAVDHPLYDVLHRRPHPEMSSFRWRELLMVHLLTTGNAYCAIGRDAAGVVRELLPLRPDAMVVTRDDDGRLLYLYHHQRLGEVRLSRDDVFHVAGLGWDGMVGYSLLSVMRDAVALGIAHEGFGTSFYKNGARPSVIATHPTTLSEPAAERIANRIRANHVGPGKNFGVLVLEEDIKLTTLAISPADAQFLEGREFQVEELARFTRISPHKLMSRKSGAVSYASVEQFNQEYASDSIQPWVSRFEGEYDLQLLDRDHYAKHNLRGLMRGATEARVAYYSSGLNGRWLVPNEVRALEDLPPVAWGDEPLSTPNNTVPTAEEPDGTQDAAA